VDESLVLWLGLELVMDELDLDGLHRADHKNGLGNTGTKTGEEVPAGGDLVVRIREGRPELLVSEEADGSLGNGANEEGGESSIESKEAALPCGDPDNIHGALVSGVKLELSLDVLKGHRHTDLNSSSQTA